MYSMYWVWYYLQVQVPTRGLRTCPLRVAGGWGGGDFMLPGHLQPRTLCSFPVTLGWPWAVVSIASWWLKQGCQPMLGTHWQEWPMAPLLVIEAEAVKHGKIEPERSQHVPNASTRRNLNVENAGHVFLQKQASVPVWGYTLYQRVS